MKNSTLKIFVLDDDPVYRKMLVCYLESLGHHAIGFQMADECLANLSQNPDVVLLDHNLEGELKGVDILRFIRSERPDISVIYITSEENVALVSDVFRSGSADFIGKDSASLLRLKLKLDELTVRKAETSNIRKRNKRMIVVGAVLLTVYLVIQFMLIV
jgi:FixJ family two-component response regulator